MRSKGPGESALLLLDVIELLSTRKIDYAVIGALAASIHGAVRASMDADVLLSLPVAKASDLARSCRDAGFQVDLTLGDMHDPIPAMLRLTDKYQNRVDALVGLRGLDPEAFSRAIEVPFRGLSIRFIGREDFVAMKVFAGGPMDVVDAERAIAAGGSSLDETLVRRLVKKFGSEAERILDRLLRS